MHLYRVLPAVSLICTVSTGYALYPQLSFQEVAQTADIVFAGTVTAQDYVTSGGAPHTEVRFDAVEVLSSTPDSLQKESSAITLTYAGGQYGDAFLEVSDSPSFITGQQYLVFMLDDGKSYMNPIVGGPGQGLFRIVKDESEGTSYITSLSGKAIVGLKDNRLDLSPQKLADISAGVPRYTPSVHDRNIPQVPVSTDGHKAVPDVPTKEELSATPLSLAQFKEQVLETALNTSLSERRLKLSSDSTGKFLRMKDGAVETLDLTKGKAVQRDAGAALPDSRTPVPADIQQKAGRGQALSPCGTQNKYITMELMPDSWWGTSSLNECMWMHNQFMDIYRTRASDGTYGVNGVNEFGGFPTSQDLSDMYMPWDWSGKLAVCFIFRESASQCSRITETDIFWNPAESWTNDQNIWWKGSAWNFRETTLHEIGHTWGLQTGVDEAYDYDVPTIMHGGHSSYETGYGLHARDAYWLRRQYSSQASILSVRDLGIESYYCAGGVLDSYTNKVTVARGSNFDVRRVTIENMSNTSISNINVNFYLSSDTNFGQDHLISSWSIASMAAESYSVNDYTHYISSTIPPGTYYILASIDSSSTTDQLPGNNRTIFRDQITITAPTIATSRNSITASATAGSDAASQTFTISNSGSGILYYLINATYGSGASGWLTVSPYYGDAARESDQITVNFDTSSLFPGTYTATLTITDPNATNNGKTIPVTLTVTSPPPPNDNFANATWLSGYSGTIYNSNRNATKEAGEPNHAGYTGGASVWYYWTPPAAGLATFETTGSNFDTIVGVYTGNAFPLTYVASDDDGVAGTRQSRVTWNSVRGTTYKIAVDGYNGGTGEITLSISLSASSSVADWSMY